MAEIDKRRSILVTGGSGFLGSYLLRQLLAEGYRHVRATRRADSDLSLVGPQAGEVDWVEADLLDIPALEEALDGVDCVIHCAAVVSFDPRDRRKMWKINVDGTANLVNLCLERGVGKFLHVSSVAAIGRRKKLRQIDEDTKWERSKFNSQYAISKHLSEMEVWRGSVEGLPVAVVNPSIILGSGDWSTGTPRFFQNVWKGLPFYPPGGSGFVDVRDVARFLVLLLESPVVGQRFVLNAENWTYRELFAAIAESLDKQPPWVRVSPWLNEFVWRFEWLRSRLTGSTPIVTRETARNAQRHWEYANERSKSVFPSRTRRSTTRSGRSVGSIWRPGRTAEGRAYCPCRNDLSHLEISLPIARQIFAF